MISFGKKREFIFAREDDRTDLDIVNDFIQLLKREVDVSRDIDVSASLRGANKLRQIIKERV